MNTKQVNLLDLISIMSFVIALINLDENITQSDMQDAMNLVNEDVHRHLAIQDEKLNAIIRMLERDKIDENYTQNEVSNRG